MHIHPPAILPLAGLSTIMSFIVVTAIFTGRISGMLMRYATLFSVMITTGVILCFSVVAETFIHGRISMVFSRFIVIILAGLPVQYVVDGLVMIGLAAL